MIIGRESLIIVDDHKAEYSRRALFTIHSIPTMCKASLNKIKIRVFFIWTPQHFTYFGWTFAVEFFSGVYHPQDPQEEKVHLGCLGGDRPQKKIWPQKYVKCWVVQIKKKTRILILFADALCTFNYYQRCTSHAHTHFQTWCAAFLWSLKHSKATSDGCTFKGRHFGYSMSYMGYTFRMHSVMLVHGLLW